MCFQKQKEQEIDAYTSLAVVYAPLPNKASGAVHLIGRRPWKHIVSLALLATTDSWRWHDNSSVKARYKQLS